MKKTWTTRILITLMTLAMVIGVVAIAPQAAQAAEITVTPDSLPDGTVGVAYPTTSINPSGSKTPINVTTWSYNDGGTGLVAAEATRTISGTPAVSGTATLTIVFTDAESSTLSKTYNIKINPANTAPKDLTVPSITGLTAGAAFAGVTCSATAGFPTDLQYSATGLPDGLSISSSSGVISGTPTTVGSGEFSVTVSNSAGLSATKSGISYTVGKGSTVLTVTPSTSPSVASGDSITLGASSKSTKPITWKVGGTTVATGPSYTFTPTANTTVIVSQEGDNNYNAPADVSITVGVDPAKVNVSIVTPANNANVSALTTIQLVGSSTTSDLTATWSQTGGAGTIANPNSLTGATYYVERADIGRTITFTLTGSKTGSTQNYKTVTVRIYNNDVITSPASNYTMSFNTATLYDVQNFTATTSYGGDVLISNSNPAIAQVTADGKTVPAGGITVPSGTLVSVKALAYGRTYIDMVPTSGSSSNGRRITAYVGSQTPTLDVQFWSSDNCTTTLSKMFNWGTLKVTVDNYNPAYPYVTITRANIRTYVQGGSYYSHPSTYTYTAALTQDISDPLKATATLYVIPQYNGSTYYSAAYTGAVTKNSPTIYVTGYTTLPQTGPNYIWAYVLGGLCLVTMATAVTLNVRKKKRENI